MGHATLFIMEANLRCDMRLSFWREKASDGTYSSHHIKGAQRLWASDETCNRCYFEMESHMRHRPLIGMKVTLRCDTERSSWWIWASDVTWSAHHDETQSTIQNEIEPHLWHEMLFTMKVSLRREKECSSLWEPASNATRRSMCPLVMFRSLAVTNG